MMLRSLAVLIPLTFAFPALAQDLENDAPIAAPEAGAVPPASDLNDAVDQLSKEQAPRPTPGGHLTTPIPDPTAGHRQAKPFAQASKAKPPKHRPVKVAKKAKKKAAKAAKKKKKA